MVEILKYLKFLVHWQHEFGIDISFAILQWIIMEWSMKQATQTYQVLSSSITHKPNTVVEAIQIYIFQVELIHKKILSHTATTLEKYDSKIHWYSSHLLFCSRIFYNCYMLCCKKDSTMEGLKQE